MSAGPRSRPPPRVGDVGSGCREPPRVVSNRMPYPLSIQCDICPLTSRRRADHPLRTRAPWLTPARNRLPGRPNAATALLHRQGVYRRAVFGIPAAKKSSPPSDLCARPFPAMLFLRPRESHEGSYPVSVDPASLLAARVQQCGDGSGAEPPPASQAIVHRTQPKAKTASS